jgi:phosphodiesterase/alkaline phosphatase D-like protein
VACTLVMCPAQDYRTRYALYMQDADLQAVRQYLPWIAIMDDHEVANDGWLHSAGECMCVARRTVMHKEECVCA